jgi:transcriptional regulator with XRE-family HTH domain
MYLTIDFMKKKDSLNIVMEQIGLALAQLRLAKGYDSIKDFTAQFGLPMIQYWRIEKGKANVTLKSLYKLLAIHSLTIQQFFCYMNQRS